MASEEQKKENLVRGLKLIIQGLAKGLWDLFGESSFAVMHPVGNELLGIMQKEMGLEIGGSDLKEVINEVGRLYVDEFGWADKIEVVEADDTHVVVNVDQCKGFGLSLNLQSMGVTHPFTCPIMNVMASAMQKISGKSVHRQIDPRADVHGSKITLKLEG
jgi:hypothetical protein